MHKSVIILIVLFLGFDVSAGRQNPEARRVAEMGLIPGKSYEENGLSFTKKKRESFDSSGSVADMALLKMLEKHKQLKNENDQLKNENDALRSKLAVSPEELSRGGEAPNPDRLSLNSGSRGTSPMTFEIPSHDELSQVTPPIVISKPCQKKVTGEGQCFYINSPCGASRRDYFSFPGDGGFSSLSGSKKVSPLAPYSHYCT